MRKLGSELDSGQATLPQPMSGRHRSAPMATTGTPLMPARLMATMAQTILPAACLSARAHGSTASTAVAASTAEGRGSMVAGQPSMVEAESDLTVDSAAAPQCAAAVDSIASPQREEGAGSMVVADSMEGATGSCYGILLSQPNGWHLMVPAVFLFLSPSGPNFSRYAISDADRDGRTPC
jgi:hypothetical protein